MTLRVFTPAKINWSLTIRGKRKDGYHDIDTVYQTLAWGDELHIRRIQRRECLISCEFPGVPLDSANLIHQAWRLFCQQFGRKVGGVEIELKKSIPPGAGLGGGSSNAVGTLVALNKLFDLNVRSQEMKAAASKLGSDCSFFLRGGAALGTGRGEILQSLKNRLPETWLVIIWPGFAGSTAEAYRRLTTDLFQSKERVLRTAGAIESGNIKRLQKIASNTFYQVVSPCDIRYNALVKKMKHEQLSGSYLSGSGSAMFGIAANSQHAVACVRRLESEYPVVVATSLRHAGVRIRSFKTG